MTNEFNTNNAIAELREIESNYTKKCEAEFLLSKTSSNEASDKSGALLIKNARMEAKKRELAVKLPKPVRSALITAFSLCLTAFLRAQLLPLKNTSVNMLRAQKKRLEKLRTL